MRRRVGAGGGAGAAIPVRPAGVAGDSDRILRVLCTHLGREIPLAECARCTMCNGILVDTTERHSFFMCLRAVEGAAILAGSAMEGQVDSAARSNHGAMRTLVAEVMTRSVVCVPERTSTDTVMGVLLQYGMSAVPVIDADGRPVGILSKTDLLREFYEGGDTEEQLEALTVQTDDGVRFELGPGFHVERLARATAREVMTPLVLSVPESAPVAKAAALMAYEGVHRVPVVGEDGRVVGIVSSLDVLQWLAVDAGALRPDVVPRGRGQRPHPPARHD